MAMYEAAEEIGAMDVLDSPSRANRLEPVVAAVPSYTPGVRVADENVHYNQRSVPFPRLRGS